MVPRTPPTTARRSRRLQISTDSSSEASDETTTPTGAQERSNLANMATDMPDLAALLRQMQQQLHENQSQMQQQLQENQLKMSQMEARLATINPPAQSRSPSPPAPPPPAHTDPTTLNATRKDARDQVQDDVNALLPD